MGDCRGQGCSRGDQGKAELPPAACGAELQRGGKTLEIKLRLVLAIKVTDSAFQKDAVSASSAMGLMQLLPSTASDEVHRFLYGRPGDVGYEDLRVPETNIRYGTAYLHILLNRYFGGVRDLM